MAGNSRRRGAVRTVGSKKGMVVGSGGQRRRALQGKGPTPKAEDRVYHTAHKAQRAAAAQGGQPAARGTTGAATRGSRGAVGPSGRPPARRNRTSSEVVAGRNAVVEALRAHVPVTTLYLAPRTQSDERIREALKIARERGIPVLETPRGELDRLTEDALHQGLAAQVPAYSYIDPRDLIDIEASSTPLLVALDGITDPRNLGAIIRSVAAFGGHGVVVPQRRSVGMTASAWKSSAGAAARVPVAQASNLVRSLEDYRAAGFFVVGLASDGEIALPDLRLIDVPLVLVVGSEGKGLSRLVRETCDQVASIPIGSIESLNAGVAASVALYEVARRRSAR
ncbi:MAG: 23S rRNA (guanosine(2251)-2'-O)-methyltransferase RlmB [Dermatophilaceae bacterium]